MKKKILIISPGTRCVFSDDSGAVELLIKDFIEQNEHDGKFILTLFSPDNPKAAEEYDNLKIVQIKTDSLAFLCKRVVRGLSRHLLRQKIPSQYFNEVIRRLQDDQYAAVIIEGNPELAVYVRKKYRGKIITHIHAATNIIFNGNIEAIDSATDLFVAVSDYVKEQMPAYIDRDKIKVVYNCQSETECSNAIASNLRKNMNIDKDDIVILFVGRACEQKGVIELVRAFERAQNAVEKKMKLVLIANTKNTMGKLNELLQRLSLTGKSKKESSVSSLTSREYIAKLKKRIIATRGVVHINYVKHEKLNQYYAMSDILVVPSLHSEAFGNVIVEGAAHGLPIIASRVGGIPEILSERAIVLVDAQKIEEEIASAIVSLSDVKSRIMIGKCAKKESEKYSRKNYYDDLCGIILGRDFREVENVKETM